MIRLEILGKCQSCPACEPRVSGATGRDFGADARHLEIYAVCANAALCGHLQRYLEEHPGRGPTGFEYRAEEER